MRTLAITGMVTASIMPRISSRLLMRATPPAARMSAGMRSSAITATAPASWAMTACSGVTTSMMTPPLSICARPRLTVSVPVFSMFLSYQAGFGPSNSYNRDSGLGDADAVGDSVGPSVGGSNGVAVGSGFWRQIGTFGLIVGVGETLGFGVGG